VKNKYIISFLLTQLVYENRAYLQYFVLLQNTEDGKSKTYTLRHHVSRKFQFKRFL